MSFVCPGSPSLPDKAKHNRDVMILLPSHRERANNSMYYNMAENGQVGQIHRMTYQIYTFREIFNKEMTTLSLTSVCILYCFFFFFFYRTTTCSVPYSSKLAPVSRVPTLTWTYPRKVLRKQLETYSITYMRRVCVLNTLMCCPSSVSEHFQQLESGWREQGAGVLHASFYWRGYHAPCPSQVLPTR